MGKLRVLILVVFLVVSLGCMGSGVEEKASQPEFSVNISAEEGGIKFTLSFDGRSFAYLLPGEFGGYVNVSGGVLLYALSPSNGTSEYAFVDSVEAERWRKTIEGVFHPVGGGEGLVVLAREVEDWSENTTVYVIDVPTGNETRFVIRERAFHVSDALVLNGTIYLAGASAFSGEAFVYAFGKNSSRRVLVDSAGDRLVGVRVLMDSDGKRIVIAYDLYTWQGEFKRGLRVFSLPELEEEASFEVPKGSLVSVEITGKEIVVKTEETTVSYSLN
ncbi:MAG: hypothetical protein ABGW50_02955 [Thermococcus sp.]